MPNNSDLDVIVSEMKRRQRFLLVSHARPDGDSIGSELALGHALRDLGKTVQIVNRDPAPPFMQPFPGVQNLLATENVQGEYDAVVVLECGTLARTEVNGLERYFVMNIDHHIGNTMFGDLNWFDSSAAACGEMIFDVVTKLGTPLTTAIATHLYIAILTDTGSFRHSNITERTFDICHQLVNAGVSPMEIANRVYQNSSIGKLRLTGTLLENMDLINRNSVAILHVDDQILEKAGCAADDLEGLINMPLAAQSVQAVVMFKLVGDRLRISLRSKGNLDVRAIAVRYGGGGHRNAAGCSIAALGSESREAIIAELVNSIRIETAHSESNL